MNRTSFYNKLIIIFLSVLILTGLTSGPVHAVPATPELVSPVEGANIAGTVIPFRWSQVTDATDYYLQVSTDSAFINVVFGGWVGNYTGVDLSGFADNGQVYYWRVAAGDATGASNFSLAWYVFNGPSDIPALPGLSSPLDGANVAGTVIPFRWAVAERAADYYLQVATDPGFTNVIFGQWVGNYTGIDLSGFPDNGQLYYWRVAAGNALGTSSFSLGWSVINGPSDIPAVPGLSSPLDGANAAGTVIPFRWAVTERAADYYLLIATDAGFTNIVFAQWVGNYTGVDLSGFPDNGQIYYWQVAAGNTLGTSNFSPAWGLINGPSAPPATPSLSSPVNGGYVVGWTIPLRWNPAERATDYRLQIAFDAGFSTVVFDQWIGNYTGVDMSGFDDNDQIFYWRVAAANSLGNSATSAPWYFINGTNPACVPYAAVGVGLLSTQTHVDSCYDSGLVMYFLKDVSRRANLNPHGHNGLMASNAAIETQYYHVGLMPDANNIWDAFNQKEGVDAQVYAGWTYDYLLAHLGINGYNNLGTRMVSQVERPVKGDGVSACSNNAFYDAYYYPPGRVYYCIGSGLLSLAGALDVAAHEWGHGVTNKVGANLAYQYESGALNEAFSDWLGTAVEQANGEINWTIGEGIWLLRDMSNPLLTSQPDTYGGTCTSTTTCPPYWVPLPGCVPSNDTDYCGVHTNSGVGNKMFYLLAAGGTHNGVSVQGLGTDTALKIAFIANDRYWIINATFLDARIGMIKSANAVYGLASNELLQIRNAWTAVKVESLPPAVNAGPDQTVLTDSSVVLAGSGSDPDGSPVLGYKWVQTGGPAVTLSNVYATNPSFTAPAASVSTILTFQLTAWEDGGETASDTVNITVNP